MFDSKGKVVEQWDKTEITVTDCWNMKKCDDVAKFSMVIDNNIEKAGVVV